MDNLTRSLNRKAETVLNSYGGLKGLAKKPAWVIGSVLTAFFTEEERREILKLRLFSAARSEIERSFRRESAA